MMMIIIIGTYIFLQKLVTLKAVVAQGRGGSRILQGRVSNPSERGTGGAKPPTCDGGGVGPSP